MARQPSAPRPALDPAAIRRAQGRGLRRREADLRRHHANLRHGLLAGTGEETLALLGEDSGEFQEYLRLLARLFLPQNERQEKLLHRLGDAIWRRLRLFRAQARGEADALQAFLQGTPRPRQPDAHQARLLAQQLMLVFMPQGPLIDHLFDLLYEVECRLRAYLRAQDPEAPDFRVFTRRDRHERLQQRFEVAQAGRQDPIDHLLRGLMEGDLGTLEALRHAARTARPR